MTAKMCQEDLLRLNPPRPADGLVPVAGHPDPFLPTDVTSQKPESPGASRKLLLLSGPDIPLCKMGQPILQRGISGPERRRNFQLLKHLAQVLKPNSPSPRGRLLASSQPQSPGASLSAPGSVGERPGCEFQTRRPAMHPLSCVRALGWTACSREHLTSSHSQKWS